MVSIRDLELCSGWQVARYESKSGEHSDESPDTSGLEWIAATVPGAVHYDLEQAGELANPFASSANAHAALWVAQSDWVYRTSFAADDEVVGQRVALQFDGVDTFADIWLNGVLIGRTENAYRSYRYELAADALRSGDNELVVHVKSHHRMIESKIPEARKRLNTSDPVEGRLGKSLIRRYQRNFFTNSSLLNLGTGVLGIGLYKPVRLLVLPEVQVSDVHVTVDEAGAEAATARIAVAVDRARRTGVELTVEATLTDPATGVAVATATGTTTGDELSLDLRVPEPKLWWPRGYGEAFQYRLTVAVREGETVHHVHEKLVGLRTVELVERDENGRETFHLRINGVRVHARGSNLIPVDYIKVHGDWAEYDRLLTLVERSNSNMIRMWGGGGAESDEFYAACDARGIMIWQDFYLHSNTYPDYDDEFVDEYRSECTELLRRIRGHACLTVLCGGNEQREGWDEWQWRDTLERFFGEKLILEVGPEVCGSLCPELPYVDNSPHGGMWCQSPVSGDAHVWGNFYNATKDPLFVTETCWNLESYSRPETLREVMGLDVDTLTGPTWPEEWNKLTGLSLITKFPFTGYHNIGGLRPYLRGLEVEQAYADYHAMSQFRLHSSSCNGMLFWSLNKGGPLFQFGCVDYSGRPLMSYYVLSRLYADLCVGVYRDVDDIRVLASNLSTSAVDAELRLAHLDVDGRLIEEWHTTVTLAPGGTTRVRDLDSYYRKIVDRTREVVHAQLLVDGAVVSEDMLLFAPVSEVAAPADALSATATKTDGGWTVEVSTTGAAKMVQLEADARLLFSDNYFPLTPGQTKRITVSSLDAEAVGTATLTISALDAPGEQTLVLA